LPAHFETARLRAVRLASEHLPVIRGFHQDERMMALIGGVQEQAWSVGYLARHVAHWADHGFGFWLLVDHSDDEPVGLGGLRTMDLDGATELEVGYAFRPGHWGRGLATEVTTRFLELAVRLAEFASTVAVIDPRNAASIGVATRLGFVAEQEVQRDDGRRLIYRRVT
jgi:RimJ/RimL family protein N-acetyltransferase